MVTTLTHLKMSCTESFYSHSDHYVHLQKSTVKKPQMILVKTPVHVVDLSFEMITLPGKIYLSYTYLMIGCQGNRTVLTVLIMLLAVTSYIYIQN